jgi:hypothetical protein
MSPGTRRVEDFGVLNREAAVICMIMLAEQNPMYISSVLFDIAA